MENYLYTCQYCGKSYKPNRRKKQLYCSNSCRVRAHHIKNAKGTGLIKNDNSKKELTKIEKMSIQGIGNAAVGALAVNLATSFFTSEENKPATKRDLQNLLKNLKNRYHPILNIPLRHDGTKPFYDLQTQSIVYLTQSNSYGTK